MKNQWTVRHNARLIKTFIPPIYRNVYSGDTVRINDDVEITIPFCLDEPLTMGQLMLLNCSGFVPVILAR